MKALEFESTISERGEITLSPDLAAEIPAGHPIRRQRYRNADRQIMTSRSKTGTQRD